MEIGGRTAVVTGGGSGIGRAVAQLLAAHGCAVVVVDRDEIVANETVQGLPAGPHESAALDVTDIEAVSRLFERLAADRRDLAGVVNSAGIMTGGEPWPASDLQQMSRVVAVNSIGTAITTTLAARYPIPADRAVVNVSSAAAIRPLPPDPTYALSKAGVLAFSRSAAMGADGLRVNVVLPGIVRTPLLGTTGSDGVAGWLAHRVDGPLLSADQVGEAIVTLFVGDQNGEAWSIELDRTDPTKVVTTAL